MGAQQLLAQRPHYGFARRGRWLDRVRRQVHAFAHGRRGAQSLRHSCRRAGRRHQSRPQAHGGSLIQCQRTTDWLGAFVPCPAGDLQSGASSDYRRAFSPSTRRSLGRRRDVVFRRAVLPRQRPRRRSKRREPSLRQRARHEIL